MEEAEHSRYVAQLKAEFDSCDTTATGFLDRDELTALCGKLQLDAHLPLLLDTLLGGRAYARVNFEEFKDGFVDVLSRSLDFSTSGDDSSYLEPVVPEEVKPKFVKGTKRYGRRSRPDSRPDAADSEDSPPSRTEATDSSPAGVRRAKLMRSTSLESVESLKSDEEAGSPKQSVQPDLQSKGPQQQQEEEEEEEQMGDAVGGGGARDHLQQLSTEELDELLRKLDPDPDGRVSIRDFKKALRGSAPVSCSTPVRSADLQRAPLRCQAVSEERSVRSTSPSLLMATVGQRVLSWLDEGSGCTSPERVVALWTEEGIRNSRDILQALDFPLEERVSLADLTLALDNELLVSGNGIHQAALMSYKSEIQHLQVVAEQACRERDKVKVDLDQADHRNLQLVREVDDRHASMETLNQSRISSPASPDQISRGLGGAGLIKPFQMLKSSSCVFMVMDELVEDANDGVESSPILLDTVLLEYSNMQYSNMQYSASGFGDETASLCCFLLARPFRYVAKMAVVEGETCPAFQPLRPSGSSQRCMLPYFSVNARCLRISDVERYSSKWRRSLKHAGKVSTFTRGFLLRVLRGAVEAGDRSTQVKYKYLRSVPCVSPCTAALCCVQEQYEKALSALQQRLEELETRLKGVRTVLQEKVQQLREQVAKNTKSSALLKDLYVENSQLMKALQVTERRQKSAEKKNFLLEEKVHALNRLLREIVPVALAT
ncbi:ninein-like protein [Micropterus dolomieu]|uniref:ninein-like protein n=1 Tax=Micropterus dolomieu TaxID=147949 RepID=UPI001E8D7E61|nr:ninein-like protein [Micropterus dolomieu]